MRGRGAAGQVSVFGPLERLGKVHVMIVPNARSNTLIPVIREKTRPDSIVYTDSFKSYDVLIVSELRHLRIHLSKLFADQPNHINGLLFQAFQLTQSTSAPSKNIGACGNIGLHRSNYIQIATFAFRHSATIWRSIILNLPRISVLAPPLRKIMSKLVKIAIIKS